MPDSKSAHLLSRLDPTHPRMAGIATAQAYVESLRDASWGRFRFEFDQKDTVREFLREHYEAWRSFDVEPAEQVCALSIEDARKRRGLRGVVELGRAWWATDDPKYGAAFERFYRDTPTSSMFVWGQFNGSQGNIELAAWFIMLDCPAFTTQGRIGFLDHLFGIADNAWDDCTSQWTRASLGLEGHNWFIHGMQMLPAMGLLFPELNRASFLLKTGWSIVEEYVRGHLKDDGGARETALGYQGGSLLSVWDLYLVAKYNGHPVSGQFVERLLEATRFLLDLATPEGTFPSFGDCHPYPGQLALLAAVAAALTGDGLCKWYAEHWRPLRANISGETAGVIPEAAFWRVGLEGAEVYRETTAAPVVARSVLKPDTGFVAMRSDATAEASYLSIAAAERGTIVTSHGHNDIFSIELHAGGTRFIGEMGSAQYGKSLAREYDKKTAAHTCFTIRGVEQAPLVDEWRWENAIRPAILRWISAPTHDFFQGSHEGFYRARDRQTLYSRKVFFRKPDQTLPHGYWVVMDWVESVKVANDYEAYFHGCVPGSLGGNTILLGDTGGPRLAIKPPDNDDVNARIVNDPGLDAYIAEKRLDARRYPCFVYEKRAESACFVWGLFPIADGAEAPTFTRLPAKLNGADAADHKATAVSVTFGDRTETLCLSHRPYDAELSVDGWTFWGLLGFRTGENADPIVNSVMDGVAG